MIISITGKPEDPQIEPHAGMKMAQGLVSPSSISVVLAVHVTSGGTRFFLGGGRHEEGKMQMGREGQKFKKLPKIAEFLSFFPWRGRASGGKCLQCPPLHAATACSLSSIFYIMLGGNLNCITAGVFLLLQG